MIRATRFSAPRLLIVYVYTIALIREPRYDCNRAPRFAFFLQETFTADDATPSESSFMTPGEMLDRDQDEPEPHKAKKPVIKIPKKLKAKVSPASASCRCRSAHYTKDSTVIVLFFLKFQIKNLHRNDPPGATSSNYLSEAAKVGSNFKPDGL